MTISYTQKVATCTGLGVFWKLLFQWKGSVYKLVWQNLIVYVAMYYSLSFTYRFGLDDHNKETFERISLRCQKHADLIPVTFVLGFYVSVVISRWWGQYKIMPWPDPCCLFISTCIQGHDDRGRLMRRTIARYLILAFVQTLRLNSVQVKKRFPTLSHLCEAGILNDNEKGIIERLDEKCIQHPKYWISLVWAGAIVTRAKKEGRIKDEFAFQTIIKEITKFRNGCGGLLDYDWISIPLVYTQVVTLAVYTFFLSSLMGRQFLDPSKKFDGHEVDFFIPVFTFLQFFFYMGWLKVAEVLINPFGEDDDDFDINWLIDRHLQVSYLIVDDMHAEHPELVKDQFWDDVVPDELPYTVASGEFRPEPFIGSTNQVIVTPKLAEFVIPYDLYDDESCETDEDDLKQIKIGSISSAEPINIVHENKAINMRRKRLDSENNSSFTDGMGNKKLSVVAKMQQMIHGSNSRSSSRLDINRVESSASLCSKNSTGRRRRRSYKSGLDRNMSKPSHLRLSRIESNLDDFTEISDFSSKQIPQFNRESRRVSECQALEEIRELLKKDMLNYTCSINKFHPATTDKEESNQTRKTDSSVGEIIEEPKAILNELKKDDTTDEKQLNLNESAIINHKKPLVIRLVSAQEASGMTEDVKCENYTTKFKNSEDKFNRSFSFPSSPAAQQFIDSCNLLGYNNLQPDKAGSAMGSVKSEFETLFELECSSESPVFYINEDDMQGDSPPTLNFDGMQMNDPKKELHVIKEINSEDIPDSLGTIHEIPESESDNSDTDMLILNTKTKKSQVSAVDKKTPIT